MKLALAGRTISLFDAYTMPQQSISISYTPVRIYGTQGPG